MSAIRRAPRRATARRLLAGGLLVAVMALMAAAPPAAASVGGPTPSDARSQPVLHAHPMSLSRSVASSPTRLDAFRAETPVSSPGPAAGSAEDRRLPARLATYSQRPSSRGPPG